ncbi:MAG: OB-fold domain-containing protein [candidate division NC10 bacterium]|nr:OB-fold domain-containing protein [candidate division NC10 bacterium]
MGRGRLLSFTTIRVPPARFRGQEPYDIAVIDLEEGLRVTARLKVPIGREAAIGDSVVFEGLVEEGPLYRLV